MVWEIPEFVEKNTVMDKRKTEYVKFREGDPILFQFIDAEPTWFVVHTIRTSDVPFLKVKHLEHDCPICSHEEYRDAYRISARFRLNILDITPEKICPGCDYKYNSLKGAPSVCSNCGHNLGNIRTKPRAEVKVLENGTRLHGMMNEVLSTLMHSGQDFDPMNCAYMISVKGRGTDMVKTFMARPDVPVLEGVFEPFDLELPEFSNEEVYQMLNGVPMRDIFQRRRDSATNPTPKAGKTSTAGTGMDFSSLPGLG